MSLNVHSRRHFHQTRLTGDIVSPLYPPSSYHLQRSKFTLCRLAISGSTEWSFSCAMLCKIKSNRGVFARLFGLTEMFISYLTQKAKTLLGHKVFLMQYIALILHTRRTFVTIFPHVIKIKWSIKARCHPSSLLVFYLSCL